MTVVDRQHPRRQQPHAEEGISASKRTKRQYQRMHEVENARERKRIRRLTPYLDR
jgi:hypothetical protein